MLVVWSAGGLGLGTADWGAGGLGGWWSARAAVKNPFFGDAQRFPQEKRKVLSDKSFILVFRTVSVDTRSAGGSHIRSGWGVFTKNVLMHSSPQGGFVLPAGYPARPLVNPSCIPVDPRRSGPGRVSPGPAKTPPPAGLYPSGAIFAPVAPAGRIVSVF